MIYRVTFLALFISFGTLHGLPATCQNLDLDSLETAYLNQDFSANQELFILRKLANYAQDPQKKIEYAELLKEGAIRYDSLQYVHEALFQQANAYNSLGETSRALDLYFEIAEMAEEKDSLRLFALSQIGIGDVYAISENFKNAIGYYNIAIDRLNALNQASSDLAIAYTNAGDAYYNMELYDSAMSLFMEAGVIFNRRKDREGSALNVGNIGMVYAKQGKTELAEASMKEAISVLEEIGNFYAISLYLTYIADIYLEEDQPDIALPYAIQSLFYAEEYGLTGEISIANERLSKIYEQLENDELSLFHFKAYVAYRDSLNNVKNVEELADQRTAFEVSRKEAEIESRNFYLKIIGGVLVVICILTYVLYRRNVYINKTRKRLEKEREKSNELLRNILPDEMAEELRDKGHVMAKKHRNVTVLFSDFKGFTKYGEQLEPEELVKTIDMYFTEFDNIMDKYDIEKIKTIGDSYMCASGLPIPREDHAKVMVLAAQEMLAHVEKVKEVHFVNEPRFDIRIGIHSGPVVAGVVGQKKFAYDIWGDTVNVAARLESTCEPGRINISKTTYELVKNEFDFNPRGKVPVKNRGELEMFYLKINGG